MVPTAEVFQNQLVILIENATNLGSSFIDVTSGDLHREVGGYPGHNHRMSTCCDVMKRNMKSGDTIISQPEKGKGATLVIRYLLPREAI